MSLDDLRAQAHALNKTLATAAVAMNELTVALQNYRTGPSTRGIAGPSGCAGAAPHWPADYNARSSPWLPDASTSMPWCTRPTLRQAHTHGALPRLHTPAVPRTRPVQTIHS